MGVRKPKPEEKVEVKDEKAKEKKFVRKKAIEGVRGIVRFAEIDIEGEKRLRNALLRVKGVGHSLSKAVVVASGLDGEVPIGSLNEEQMKKLDDVLKNPLNYGIPIHMLNRRLDPQTGENRHLVSSELSFAVRSDIDFMKKIRSYKGIRHELGLPVRGQRTRSSFRTGGIVGVVKKKLAPGAAPAPAGAKPAPAAAAAPAPVEKKEAPKK